MLSRMKGRKDLLKLLKQIQTVLLGLRMDMEKQMLVRMVKGITPNIACSNVPKRKKVLVPIQCSHLHFPHFKNKELEKAQIMAKIMTKQEIRAEIAILWTEFHI